MFCVVNISERKGTIKEKLFWRFIKDEYELKTIPVFKGAPFYRLDITVGKKGVDWEYVSYCIGKCAGRLIVNKTVSVPENFGLGRYDKRTLYSKMMQNTFVHILKQQNKIFEKLCFVDEKGNFSEFLDTFVPYFNRITVITENKDAYSDICDNILEETGLCVVVQSEYENAQVIIGCEKNTMQIKTRNNIYNISDGEEFFTPEIYEKLYDKTLDKLNFYSALYEFCGVFDLADLIFTSIQINTQKKETNAIILT